MITSGDSSTIRSSWRTGIGRDGRDMIGPNERGEVFAFRRNKNPRLEYAIAAEHEGNSVGRSHPVIEALVESELPDVGCVIVTQCDDMLSITAEHGALYGSVVFERC